MPVKMKDPRANEFRAKAELIRQELLDPTKEFTKDEINTKSDAMTALLQRAQLVAGFTPAEEIEDQGGDEDVGGVIRGAPESGEDEDEPRRRFDRNGIEQREETAYQKDVRTLARRVEKAFGGPNSLILALARRSGGVMRFNTNQQRVLDALDALTKRTIVGATGDVSGGEFLLPLQQDPTIFMVANTVRGLVEYARRYTMSGRTLRLPYLKQTYAGDTRPFSSIADVSYVDEAGEKPLREPKFGQRLLTAYNVKAYTELGDETLGDDMTGQLSSTVQGAIGGAVMNFINQEATMDGTGTSALLAGLSPNNPSLYKVSRVTTNLVKFGDISNMLSHFMTGPQSAWYAHPSVMPQIYALTLGSNSLVSWITDLKGRPTLQLMGLPIIETPLVKVLGAQSDLSLMNGEFYAYALRQALTIESSIHYKFRDDITAYRFYARAAGIPIPDGTYSYKSISSTKEWEMSPFVTLDDVQAS